ncbi:MAG TPA: DUF6516 family protein [Methylomirabilota bacterium]|jgi:hypothetical protein|nr:DUF6516 family protein [Methylomirabilota bacterium]
MLATERLLEIEQRFDTAITRIVPLELDGQTLRLILYLKDGTNLRLTEQWNGDQLERYSYYWLTPENELKIGWDNAPHHTHLDTFPHHKHVDRQANLQPSSETRLEEVMASIRGVVK